jgi:hypothetical protein
MPINVQDNLVITYHLLAGFWSRKRNSLPRLFRFVLPPEIFHQF